MCQVRWCEMRCDHSLSMKSAGSAHSRGESRQSLPLSEITQQFKFGFKEVTSGMTPCSSPETVDNDSMVAPFYSRVSRFTLFRPRERQIPWHHGGNQSQTDRSVAVTWVAVSERVDKEARSTEMSGFHMFLKCLHVYSRIRTSDLRDTQQNTGVHVYPGTFLTGSQPSRLNKDTNA